MEESKHSFEIYRSTDGNIELKVRLDGDTVWLSQSQMAQLFGVDRSVVVRHIGNIYKSEELTPQSTCAKNAQVQIEGKRRVKRTVPMYNLDMIISVGYRVNSINATKFRQWATSVLKQYIVQGYAVNQSIRAGRYEELKSLVCVMARTIEQRGDQTNDIIAMVRDYVYALDTLDRYDYQQLAIDNTTHDERFRADYDSATAVIRQLRDAFGDNSLFGNEKDGSFRSSIGQIYQTFDGCELYPSIEEKAAMLLYLVVKNHSFTDGNKRIAATLFLWFLERNNILYRPDGTKRIADNTLVALTLMIAESHPDEKDIMVKVVVNLINKNNS